MKKTPFVDTILAQANHYGVSIRFAESLEDLRMPGVHVPNPDSLERISDALASALENEMTTIFLYIQELKPCNLIALAS